jgi:hypothetical protein
MKKDITELFCFVYEFRKLYEEEVRRRSIVHGIKRRKPTRVPGLADSEVITIILLFQQSSMTNFKHFYKLYLKSLYQQEFPQLPSYERFISLMPRVFGGFVSLLQFTLVQGCEINYIDATAISVCHTKRTRSHKVFNGFAKLGKTTMGWFFGLKLHLIINAAGELVNVAITPGNTDDRKPVPSLAKRLSGLLFGDKGYISESLFKQLFNRGVKLVTGIKKKMKNKLMNLNEKILLRKRSIIETVFDHLKNKMLLEHTRHRSPINAFIHIISTLVAYQLKPTKPSIKMRNLITD